MPYTPNPYNSLQPEDSVFAGTAAAEFRAMKIALQALSTGSLYRGDWSSFVTPAPATLGDQFTHDGSLWLLKTTVADVTLIEPDVLDTVNWFKLYESTTTGLVAKTSSTGEALMPNGTTAQRGGAPVLGSTRFNTTLDCNETWNGTYWIPEGWVELASVSTAAGASAMLSALPAWPNELALRFEGLSISVNDDVRIRLGTVGGLVTVGYFGASQYVNMAASTVGNVRTGGIFLETASTVAASGDLILRRRGTTWSYGAGLSDHGPGGFINTAGRVDIAGVLTQIEIAAPTGALDAGMAYLMGRK